MSKPKIQRVLCACRTTCLALACAVALPVSPAAAQSAGQPIEDRPWTLGLAIGHGQRSNPFVASDDVNINAIVDLAWYGEHFFFDNGDLGYTLIDTPRMSLSTVLGFNNERNYFSYLGNGSSGIDLFSLRQLAEDNGFAASGINPGTEDEAGRYLDTLSVQELEDFVFSGIDSDLPERDFAANGGLELLYTSTWGDLQAQVWSDLSSTHNGQSVWLSYAYPWLTATTDYSLTVGLEWKSRSLVDYYYGVTPLESLPGRAAFEGSSGTNSVIRFAANRTLSRHWKLVGVVEREFLSSAIRRSPIIKDHAVDTVYFGLYYQF